MQSDSSGSGPTEIRQAPGEKTTAEWDPVEILDTIDLPIVVVARDFTIARFNRPAGEALSLASSDIGRSARDVAKLADLRNLEKWCAEVLSTETTSRHDFRNGDQTFVLRIAPYSKSGHGVSGTGVSGTVLTFANVTAFRASLDEAIYEREYTKAILNTGTDPIVVLSQELRLQTANRAFYRMFGVSREAMQSIPLHALENGAFDLAQLRTQLQKMIADGTKFQAFEEKHNFPAVGRRALGPDPHPFSLPGDSRPMILLSFHDITARQEAEAS